MDNDLHEDRHDARQMGEDLRLAAELGSSLMTVNEQLQLRLSEAVERERDANRVVADLRRMLAATESEILSLSSELVDLKGLMVKQQQQQQQLRHQPVSQHRLEQLEEELSVMTDQLVAERDAIAFQTKSMKQSAEYHARDVETMRLHCSKLTSQIDTILKKNALFELRAYARQRRIQRELLATNARQADAADAKCKAMEMEMGELRADNTRLKDVIRTMQEERARRPIPSSLQQPPMQSIDDDQALTIQSDGKRNTALMEYFFMTAVACKLDLVENGFAGAAFTMTNEQLYDAAMCQPKPIPFFHYNDWVRCQLVSTTPIIDPPPQPRKPSSPLSVFRYCWPWFLWRKSSTTATQ